MNQKTVGLTLKATIIALALILVVGSPALPPLDGVAYAQGGPTPDCRGGAGWHRECWLDRSKPAPTRYDLYKQPEGGKWSAPMPMTGLTYNDDRRHGRHE